MALETCGIFKALFAHRSPFPIPSLRNSTSFRTTQAKWPKSPTGRPFPCFRSLCDVALDLSTVAVAGDDEDTAAATMAIVDYDVVFELQLDQFLFFLFFFFFNFIFLIVTEWRFLRNEKWVAKSRGLSYWVGLRSDVIGFMWARNCLCGSEWSEIWKISFLARHVSTHGHFWLWNGIYLSL